MISQKSRKAEQPAVVSALPTIAEPSVLRLNLMRCHLTAASSERPPRRGSWRASGLLKMWAMCREYVAA